MDKEKKPGVLVVDDENSNILALTHILSPDYSVYAAKNGRNAIEAAEKFLPDVILLDIVMPDMDGYEVIKILKNSEKTRNIPVIFITGLGDSSDEEKGLAMGASDYVNKPFKPAILKLRIQNQITIIKQTKLVIAKEIAEKSNRTKIEFLSRMNHEMRTPLNAIIGMAILAKNTLATEERNDMLNDTIKAANHLLKLIEDILDMSDIAENRFRLSCSKFSFPELMNDILNEVKPGIKEKQQSFIANVDPSIPEMLDGDRKRLRQVLMHLLSNAQKFTPEQGSIKLNASAGNVTDKTITLRFELIDSGIGISGEQREFLFDPFQQADDRISRNFDGAGLGLAIAKYIIELMDGRIWVESEPGKGSKFSFNVKMSKGD